MHSKRAISTSRRACQSLRQTNPAFSALKKLSTAELKLLYSSRHDFRCFRHTEQAIDFTEDVAFKISNDFVVALSVFGAFLDVGKRWFVAAPPDDGYTIECCVGLPIAASIQTEAVGFATGCRNWANTAELGKERMRVGSLPTRIDISAIVNVAMPSEPGRAQRQGVPILCHGR